MKAAGIGFREAASLASLLDALARAGAAEAEAVGLPAAKAAHPAARALAETRALVLIAPENLAAQETLTESPAARAAHGAGSVAEAAALAAAGPGARLAGPRAVSQDRLATAALASSGDQP